MGNETSSEAKSTLGLHVVGIEAGSSADRAGIQLYFDYLTHLNGQPIIKQQLNSLDDGPHDFIVYSTKSRAHRGITIVPIVGGSRLGMKLKLCDYSKSPKNVYQILDMYTVSFRNPDSPASIAGLIAHDDFVIATTMTKHKLDFQELIRDNIGKFVELYVYNTVQDSIRRVLIEPRDDWGGVGLLGCNVGHGYSHTIALAIQKASAAKDGLKSPELRTDDKIRPLKLDSSGDSRDLASAAVSDGPKSETEVNETPVEPILETEENATPTTNDEPKLKLEDPISDERLASPNISYPPVIV